MTREEAKKQANGIVWALLESYFDAGQPLAQAHEDGTSEEDAKLLECELRTIQKRFRVLA